MVEAARKYGRIVQAKRSRARATPSARPWRGCAAARSERSSTDRASATSAGPSAVAARRRCRRAWTTACGSDRRGETLSRRACTTTGTGCSTPATATWGGIHQMDLCRWALGHEGLSSRILSVGGASATTTTATHRTRRWPSTSTVTVPDRVRDAGRKDRAAQEGLAHGRRPRHLHRCVDPLRRTAELLVRPGLRRERREDQGVGRRRGPLRELHRRRAGSRRPCSTTSRRGVSALSATGNISQLGAGADPDELRELCAGRGPTGDAVGA